MMREEDLEGIFAQLRTQQIHVVLGIGVVISAWPAPLHAEELDRIVFDGERGGFIDEERDAGLFYAAGEFAAALEHVVISLARENAETRIDSEEHVDGATKIGERIVD